MKLKTAVAYLPESSVTVRLTPTQMGQMMGRMSSVQLKECMDSFQDYIQLYAPQETRLKVLRVLNSVKIVVDR